MSKKSELQSKRQTKKNYHDFLQSEFCFQRVPEYIISVPIIMINVPIIFTFFFNENGLQVRRSNIMINIHVYGRVKSVVCTFSIPSMAVHVRIQAQCPKPISGSLQTQDAALPAYIITNISFIFKLILDYFFPYLLYVRFDFIHSPST